MAGAVKLPTGSSFDGDAVSVRMTGGPGSSMGSSFTCNAVVVPVRVTGGLGASKGSSFV